MTSPFPNSDHEMMARVFGALGEDVYWHRMTDQDGRMVDEIDIRTPAAADHTIELIKGWLVEMLEAEWPATAS